MMNIFLQSIEHFSEMTYKRLQFSELQGRKSEAESKK